MRYLYVLSVALIYRKISYLLRAADMNDDTIRYRSQNVNKKDCRSEVVQGDRF